MATGVSGYIDVTVQPSSVGTIRLFWREDYYIEGNYSTITITDIQGYIWHRIGWADIPMRVTAGGITIMDTDQWMLSCQADTTFRRIVKRSDHKAEFTPITSGPIYHNDDGTKSINISFTLIDCIIASVGFNGSNDQNSTKSVTLTTIPRASSITATDANIGSVSQLTITRKATIYTHTIKYDFGSLSGYIDESGDAVNSAVKMETTSIGFTVPTTFYTQIPNSKNGVCTLTITTYLGDEQISTPKTCTFTATASESLCKPDISGAVVDINEATLALTGSADILVRYMSDALCTIYTEAKNSATVSSKTIGGVNVTENTRTIVGIETDTVTFATTDSRGYSNSVDVTKSFVPYVKLTNNATAARPDPTSGKVTLTLQGACFNGNFGIKDNSVTAVYSVNGGEQVNATVTMNGNAYSVIINLTGFDYQSSHTIDVVVSDELMVVSKTLPVQKGIPVFDWGEDDFRFNVDARFGDSLTMWSDNEGGNIEIKSGNGHTNAWQIDAFDGHLRFYTFRESDGMIQGITFDQETGSLRSDSVLGAYPVGAVYISFDPTSPASLFGGTWERLPDAFLWSTRTDSNIGKTGGESAHTLTADEMPSHMHKGYVDFQNVGFSADEGMGTWTTSLVHSTYSQADIGRVTGYTGGSAAHNNMPPYLEVAMWKRLY